MSNIKVKNRIRKSTRVIYILIASIILISSFYGLLKGTQSNSLNTKKEQIYTYTNKFNFDYKVNLIENKYMKDAQIKNQTAYITDLMDTTTMNLNYEYIADKKTNIQGEYSVIGRMNVVYTRDGEEQKIWTDEDTLVNTTPINEISDVFKIQEKIDIDLKNKNKLLEDFEQQMGMTIEAHYSVILNIKLNTKIEDKPVEIDYNPIVKIELANKTTKIIGENNKEETEYISKEYEISSGNKLFNIVLSIIGIVTAIVIFRYLSKFRTANVVRNEFRQELNRILKICQDKIVQVDTKPITTPEDTVTVKDFGEIVKVSEELFKPILYYYDNEKEEAWFSVMTGKIIYKYILKR